MGGCGASWHVNPRFLYGRRRDEFVDIDTFVWSQKLRSATLMTDKWEFWGGVIVDSGVERFHILS